MLTRVHVRTPAGVFDVSQEQRAQMLGLRRWGCVRRISANQYVDLAGLLEHAPLIGLRELRGVCLPSLLGLRQRSESLPVVDMELLLTREEFGALAVLDELAPMLPELARLRVSMSLWREVLTPELGFFRSPLVRGLRELLSGDGRFGGVPRVDEWLGHMLRAECHVPTLRLSGALLDARAEQVEAGRFTLELRLKELWAGDACEPVFTCLARLPRAAIVSVTLRSVRQEPALAARLEQALAGLPREA